ncbi:MAG: DUF2059 domain-containing protein [Acidobacteria bacterium]|nr:DUF2059 domain-containing protein [Acidobacteriota bacterium]
MRRLAVLPMLAVCAATLSAQTAAPAAPPSLNAPAAAPAPAPISPEKEAKIEKLISLMTTDAQIKNMITQTQQQLHTQVSQRAAAGTTDEQKKIGADYLAKVDAATATLNWEKAKPAVIRAYAEEFSDADLDAYIAFFSSPAGKDFIAKSPAVGNKVGDAARAQFREIAPSLQAATREFNEKMKAATPPTLSPLDPPHAPAAAPAPQK